MKQYLLLLVFYVLNTNLLSAQAIGANGVQSDSRIIDLFEDIKNRVGKKTTSTQKIKGSPYFDETFKAAEVEYFGEILKDKIYLRLNAFSDEMEMASSPLMGSSENILIKNNKVSCIINGDTYRYLGFIADNQPPAVGYLKELFKGRNFAFYERNSKVYMEATVARTSLERSFPARFIEKTEYYYSVNNGALNQLKLSRKKILTKLKPYSSSIKMFMNDNDTKLKSLQDVVALFNFLDQV